MGLFNKTKKILGLKKKKNSNEEEKNYNRKSNDSINSPDSLKSSFSSYKSSSDLESEVSSFNGSSSDLESEVSSFNGSSSDLESEVSSLNKQSSKLNTQHHDSKAKGFKYLESLINSGAKEIVLENDITIEDDEMGLFTGGILIESDSIIIDGNGHFIDARKKARIFKVLGSNITLKNISFQRGLSSEGGAISNNGNLRIENCSFLQNQNNNPYNIHSGGAIYNGGELYVSGSKFCENIANGDLYGGGSIDNRGRVYIIDSSFSRELAKNQGGAIYNYGKANLKDCRFHQCSAKGGAVIYNGKVLSMENTLFKNNNSKGVIYNKSGSIKIIKCHLLENGGLGSDYTIFNNDQLSIEYSVFDRNNAYMIISNGKDSDLPENPFKHSDDYEDLSDYAKADLTIYGGEFRNNNTGHTTIYNYGKLLSINKTKFEGNSSLNSFPDICNQTYMALKNPKVSSKTIENNGKILLKDTEGMDDFIENNGIIETNIIPDGLFDFGYLDNEIHSCDSKEYVLTEDIRLENYEMEFYEGGIVLDIDGLTIDGNNHTIDGRNLSRIFTVCANVTLKNLTFKNGYSHENHEKPFNSSGAIIRNNSKSVLILENCSFLNSKSEKDGGAINNFGKIILNESYFANNVAEKGGSINNFGFLKSNKTVFTKNKSNYGGSIYNSYEMELNESTFKDNSAISQAGAVYNDKGSSLCINGSCFRENTITTKHALVIGGAIYNGGKLSMNNAYFYDNTVYLGRGPAVFTDNSAETIDNGSVYKDNLVIDDDDDY
ncbi:MAG: right-handed parallel beta-helix repeat-containing protein [Methanobrevibacter sp.]|nr:right-handed parallel beta-helix repeat-containing protein [Methanobrevibacter sp.]